VISEIRSGFGGSDEIRNRSCARADAENELPAAQRSFTQPPRAFTCRPDWHANLRSTRGGSPGPANGTWSAAV